MGHDLGFPQHLLTHARPLFHERLGKNSPVPPAPRAVDIPEKRKSSVGALSLRKSLHKCPEPEWKICGVQVLFIPKLLNNNVWYFEAANHAIFLLSIDSRISLIGRTIPILLRYMQQISQAHQCEYE